MAFTVLVKLVFFPLANKSLPLNGQDASVGAKDSKPAGALAVGDDRMALNKEMMALYKAEQVNPAAGCLPVLLQIPVFFALYKVLFVTIEMRHAPFFGWITDLSPPDPTFIFNLFGILPYSTDFLPLSRSSVCGRSLWESRCSCRCASTRHRSPSSSRPRCSNSCRFSSPFSWLLSRQAW